MTDTGAVIRAIRMNFPDSVICDTLKITTATLDIIKTDYDNLKRNFEQGRKYDDAAALLMKDPGEVWYAYHVFETDIKTLEQEIMDENEGKPRPRPPPITKKKIGVEGVTGTALVDRPGAEREKEKDGEEVPRSKKEKRGVTREKIKNAPGKDKIGDELTREAEAPAGAVLMEDAGRIAKELAEKRQAIGKFVMETMDLAARQMGYTDHLDFLGFIYQHFINNYGKAEQKDKLIKELIEANDMLADALSERNRRAKIDAKVDWYVKYLSENGMPISANNLLEYHRYQELLYPALNAELLLKPQGEGVENNAIKSTQ